MEKEIKAVREMGKKIPNIIEDIEKISKEYEASTLSTGMTFLHILFDKFVKSQELDIEKAYKEFASAGITLNRNTYNVDILSEKRS